MPRIDYPYLRAWNVQVGGNAMWNVDLARKEGAPEDVIFRRAEGGWARLDDAVPHVRAGVIAQARSRGWVD